MDPRRLLILAAAGLLVSGCAVFRQPPAPPAPIVPIVAAAAQDDAAAVFVEATDAVPAGEVASTARPYEPLPVAEPTAPAARNGPVGRAAIAAANVAARSPSRADAFVGGVQVFAWSPGRVFEIWTAPLRVTTLTLGPGETLVTKAAGDTVRWQMGEAVSGAGPGQRNHVLLKPLERGLETNLVLTTNRRVYLIELRSGAADAFNAAVAWDAGSDPSAPLGAVDDVAALAPPPRGADPVAMPEGEIDARYRIEPQGRRARWTPTSVFNDGLRTFITFDPDLQVDEAPVLFVIAPDGEAQMVNYRQAGGLYIVDRLFDRAELRLGDRRPQVVRLRRLTGAHP